MNLPAVTDSVDIYIAEINRFPLLKAEEEFKQVNTKLDRIIELREK